ncbi:phosphoserine aminotransferase apoenzyme [Methylophilus rhizosphaerae]|uniref:Phosphoserine aminotransferase n=1 Tax=Methylophilus rhizosphaerae TaxID=492660 RepID=A0A1G9BUS7_9PROT|nr:phosphoserine transaminase [Methylophilus rhizosphaerae]SDK42904.1 phosphoserine aminotransferase apoenzyme [Methylophilus rhizosphaerae]
MKPSANQLNFSGGPGALPESVLQQLHTAMLCVPETGLSILGISHRSEWFAQVVHELENNIRQLMGLPSSTRVLMMQGGATQQFSMLPMNLLRNGESADYIHSGYWSGKAIHEAEKSGRLQQAWSGKADQFSRLPSDAELALSKDAAYFHYVSNETVEGLQFHRVPGLETVPRICDMSSDLLSAPAEFNRYAMIYAHAQKNIGPAGVTVVILRDDFMNTLPDDLPGFINYHAQADAHSIYNTPPVFAIYSVLLVTRWLRDEIGGLHNMAQRNQAKADCLYQLLDDHADFYRGRAATADRSKMNVVFNLPDAGIEQAFLQAARQAGFSGLNGHRSIGGIRASIYNGLEFAATEHLADFMRQFHKRYRIPATSKPVLSQAYA